MITAEDTQKLIDAFTNVFPTKEHIDKRFDDLRQDYSNLQTSVDKLVKKFDTYLTEQKSMGSRLDRHEAWIKEIATKLNIKLPDLNNHR